MSRFKFFLLSKANILTFNNPPELVIVVVVVAAAVFVVDRVKYSTFPNRILSSFILPKKDVKSGNSKNTMEKILKEVLYGFAAS